MAYSLIWGILIAVICGGVFGSIAGNTPIGIAIAIAVGVVVAGIAHWLRNRPPDERSEP